MKDFLRKTALLNRSIISEDFEKTLSIINQEISLKIHRYPSGTQCFDWVIPKQWNIRDAYVKDSAGRKLIDWKEHPLHIVVGSLPVHKKISRKELMEKLFVSHEFPNEIPYEFKFYELDWGFCTRKKDLKKFKGNSFEVKIDADYTEGHLLLGEHIIEGSSKKSIVLMSHIDHPGQINDGVGGAALLIELAKRLRKTKPAYTLRFQFLAERIGSIAYLYSHRQTMGDILGGIFCEMPGVSKYPVVLQYSKWADTRLDRISEYVLSKSDSRFITAPCFSHIQNDDAFYNSPGIDIPCVSITRSKRLEVGKWYHFPFYHTSGDNLQNFDFSQAEKVLEVLEKIIVVLNKDRKIIRKYEGVPHLSRHRLWVDWRKNPKVSFQIDAILNLLDNRSSIFDIAQKLNLNFEDVSDFISRMEKAQLVSLESTESIWFSPENSFEKLASRRI